MLVIDNLQFRSTETEWHLGDTQDLYRHNLEHRFEELHSAGWIDKTIKYKFNSHGFRCEEFKESKNILFLGCSITFGTALRNEDIFPTQVSRALGYNCCNLALSGSSNDTAFRLAETWLSRIKPDIVLLMSPDKSRLEITTAEPEGSSIHFRVNNTVQNYAMTNSFYLKWIMHEENARLNQLKNQLAIKHLCNTQGIKFLNFNIESDFCFIENDLARDLSHPGILSHRATTEKILNFIS
jgi:hypothetical protein